MFFSVMTPMYRLVHSSSSLAGLSTVRGLAMEFGRERNLSVQVSPEIANLPIFVARTDQSPELMLKALAAACDATVTRTDKGIKIFRSEADKARLRAIDRKLMGELLEKSAERWDPGVHRSSSPEEDAQSLQGIIESEASRNRRKSSHRTGDAPFEKRPAIMQYLPAGRLLRQVAEKIGVEELVDLDPQTTAFYSNQPSADEELIPDSVGLVSVYAAEREAFRLKSQRILDWNAWTQRKWPNFSANLPTPPLDSIKIVLKVHREALWYTLQLSCFDPSGDLMDSAWFASVPEHFFGSYGGQLSSYFKLADARWCDLSQLSASFAAHYPDIGIEPSSKIERKERQSISQIGSEFPIFWNPRKFEPQKVALPEALAGITNSSSGWIACLPDESWSQALGCIKNNRLNLNAFQALSFGEPNRPPTLETERLEGFEVLKPVDAYVANLYATDRQDLSDGLAEILRADKIQIRNWSKLQSSLGLAGESELVGRYTRDFTFDEPDLTSSASAFTFRFLGALSDSEWEDLLANKSVSIGSPLLASRLHESIVRGDWQVVSQEHLTKLQMQPQQMYQETVHPDVPVSLRRYFDVVVRSWVGDRKPDPFADSESATPFGSGFGETIHAEQRVREATHRVAKNDRETLSDILQNSKLHFARAPRTCYTFSIGDPQGTHLEKTLYEVGEVNDEDVSFADLGKAFQDDFIRAALAAAKEIR